MAQEKIKNPESLVLSGFFLVGLVGLEPTEWGEHVLSKPLFYGVFQIRAFCCYPLFFAKSGTKVAQNNKRASERLEALKCVFGFLGIFNEDQHRISTIWQTEDLMPFAVLLFQIVLTAESFVDLGRCLIADKQPVIGEETKALDFCSVRDLNE